MNMDHITNTTADKRPLPKKFTLKDKLFALLCFVLGYFCAAWCLLSGYGIGVTAASLAVLLAEVVYLLLSGKKIGAANIFALIAAGVLSCGFLFTSSPWVLCFNYIAVYVGVAYLYYCCAGNSTDGLFGQNLFFDLIKSMFVIPFSGFINIWLALFGRQRDAEKKKEGQFGYILLGILIAFIPTCIVILLLSSDSAFSAVLDEIFRIFNLKDFLNRAVLAIPVAMYLFGMIYGAVNDNLPQTMTPERNAAAREKMRFIPCVTSYAALIPLLLVYVIFFVSQSAYFLSAFSGILPENYSYAEYARGGFFELCAVAVINLLVLSVVHAFTKRDAGKGNIVSRVLNFVLCLFTIGLIVIDLRKMILYIGQYGLTEKRVLTSWFMLLLGMVFLALAGKQLFVRLRFALTAACITGLMLALLLFANVDGMIAKYNVDAYLNGSLETVDFKALEDLDDGAVGYVLPLLDCEDDVIRFRADEYCKRRQKQIANKRVSQYTIYTFVAKNKLEKGR